MAPLDALDFRHAVLLWPVATAVHVREEWPRFPAWARRFASPAYSDREYLAVHALTIGSAALAALALWRWPAPWLVLAVATGLFGPGVVWNACFHVGATVWSRTYCAGALTAALLYLPLAAWLGRLAIAEALVGPGALGVALGLALVLHVAEVGHNVFKRW